MKFSIIIPCYNTEAYLGKCIESIIAQTYDDWEIILVNDGSTDYTAKIMKYYVQQDARIKAFYQENQGVSMARNHGIKEASGDYIMFCDSDDWYCDKSALEQIAAAAFDGMIDIIAFQYIEIWGTKTVYGNNNLQYFSEKNVYSGEEYLQGVLRKKSFYQWFLWLYALKRELFIRNNISFNNNTYAFEDAEIGYQIIVKANTIKVLKKHFYGYRIGREGQATIPSGILLRNMIKVSGTNISNVNSLTISYKTKKLLNNNFSHIYYMVLILVCYLPKEEQQEIFKLLETNRNIMKYTCNRKDQILRIVIHILGLYFTGKLLYIRSKWRGGSGRE